MQTTFFERVKYYLLFLRSIGKMNWGLIVGMWKLTKLSQPAITVFGGTKLSSGSIHNLKICDLTRKLSERGFSILTGGGAGVMEAANLGAYETATALERAHQKLPNHKEEDLNHRMLSMGIGVTGLESRNAFLQEFIVLPYFFVRKWLLVRYAVGFIVAPGGFGTLDEFAEVITLIQTKQMPRAPIVMIGTEYWGPFFDWIHNRALPAGLLTAEDANLVILTDDIDQAFSVMVNYCSSNSQCAIEFNQR